MMTEEIKETESSSECDKITASGIASGYPVDAAADSLQVPVAPPKPFNFTAPEGIAALLTYALAFLYTYAVTEFFTDTTDASWKGRIIAAAFVLLFMVVTELVHRDTPRPKESLFWLVCTLLTAAAQIGGIAEAWDGLNILFLHAFAVYYALVRSGKLMDKTSGAYVFLDGWHAFLGWPFRFFFRKVRTAFRFVFGAPGASGDSDKKSSLRFLWAIPVFFVGGLLLRWAIGFLIQADASFGELLEKFAIDWDWSKLLEIVLRFVISLPVGSYIYGSLDGGKQEERGNIDAQKAEADRFLGSLGHVPYALWLIVLGVFTVVYVAFFVVQGGHIFAALFGRLPEGFTASAYARQGFFELCKVMVVNFALLWLVNFTSDAKARTSAPLRISLTLLMTESILLAVTALARLILYISRFGFTPLRIQSSWLVVVLLFGCILYLVHLWTEKKTFRLWLLFSCGLLALTQLL